MAISKGLQIFVVALAISCTLATPIKRSKSKLARQIEFTTPSSVVDQKTGYPEAGFRPKIPFHLPNEKPQTTTPVATTEAVEEYTSTTTESTLEDFDEIVPTTIKSDVEDHTPADTYGAPFPSPADNADEIEAKVVPAPAEDFQPPSEDASQDFASPFDVIDTNAGDVIADLPAFEQTSEAEDLDKINVNQLPAATYGAPEVDVNVNEPKTDVETVETELETEKEQHKSELDEDDAEIETEKEDGQHEQQDDVAITDVEVTEEGSAESELGPDSEPEIHEPADTYGVPKTEFDEENEIDSELAEVEQQLEILSRLTRMKTGRLVILPIEKNLYLGRLVSSQPKRAQRKNGRLLKL